MSEASPAAASALAQTRFVSGLGELADAYDVILCDVWGVLHNGMRAHPGAAEALTRYRAGGGAVVLVSNAPRPGASVIGQLDRLGVPRTAFDDIVTSGDLTRTMVRERAGSPVFHLGPERDLPIFEGLDVRLAPAEEAAYCVCSGLWNDATDEPGEYRDLLAGLAAREMLMICANPDIVVEVGDRLVYCAGALAALYEELGGKTVYTGKPHPPVYAEALARAARIRGEEARPGRVLAIGDAIRTDVAGAHAIGAAALFVARGIHSEDLRLAEGKLDPAIARPWLEGQTHRPDHAVDMLVWK